MPQTAAPTKLDETRHLDGQRSDGPPPRSIDPQADTEAPAKMVLRDKDRPDCERTRSGRRTTAAGKAKAEAQEAESQVYKIANWDAELTAPQWRAVIGLVAGMTITECAEQVGVSRQTVSYWCNRHADFRHALKVARAEFHVEALDRLRVGDYRVLFTVEGDTLKVYRIVHRREAYE